MFQYFKNIGRMFLNRGWNIKSGGEDEHFDSLGDQVRDRAIQVAILAQLDAITRAIEELPRRIAIEQNREAMRLEKQKQKTANAIEKAENAKPPIIQESTIDPADLEKAFRNRRVNTIWR